MAKYRKKPVVIEAFQMMKERRNSEWPNWLNKAWTEDAPNRKGTVVSWNDYIIQGEDGDLYTCKPDIFEKTYERII